MSEEIELGAVPASESAGYGEAVTDAEFEDWVKRSQGDTDAALRDWDDSVHFDQIRSMVPPPLEDDGIDALLAAHPYTDPELEEEVIEAEILNEDGTVATAEEVNESRRVAWQSMAERIRAGEELGPGDRARVENMMRTGAGPMPTIEVEFLNVQCDDPACGCHSEPPVVRSRPVAPADLLRLLNPFGGLPDPFAEEIARRRRAHVAQQNLERMGFVVVDDAARPRSSGLALPHDEAVAWAKREFGVIPPNEAVPGYNWTRG